MQGAGTPAETVGLTVRGTTADDAEVRILLEASIAADDGTGTERLVHALVVQELSDVVAGATLDRLVPLLSESVARVAARSANALEAVDAHLGRLEIVAVEHLLVSPSGPVHALSLRIDDPEAGPPGSRSDDGGA